MVGAGMQLAEHAAAQLQPTAYAYRVVLTHHKQVWFMPKKSILECPQC